MIKDESDFEKIVNQLNIDTEPNPAHRENLRQQMLSAFNKTELQSESRITVSQKVKKIIMKNPLTKLAAAALIILAISFFMIHPGPGGKVDTADVPTVTKSPAEMLTTMSLMMTYRRGGIEAIEKQCDEAIEKLGPWKAKITAKELFTEFNGT